MESRGALFLRVGRHPLTHRIEENLRIWCIVRGAPIPPILVGVSGGVDSISLLTVLAALRERDGSLGELAACCVHHHLRPEADGEVELVHSHCERLGVRFLRRDVRPADEGGNLAAACRRLRYEALEDAAREAGALAVATAHHADDQLETVLMALCRGTGIAGLAGMRWRRSLGEGLTLVRPMLDVPRAEIHAFATELGLRWAEDQSNADASTARGMLREKVIPHLLAHWPQAARHAAHSSDAVEGVTAVLRKAFAERADPRAGDADGGGMDLDLGGIELEHPEVVPILLRTALPPGATGDVRLWAAELLHNDHEPRVYDAGPEWELHIRGMNARFKARVGPPGTP